jgi:hypothetical protein
MQKVNINNNNSLGIDNTKFIQKINMDNKIKNVDMVEKQFVSEKSNSLATSLGLVNKSIEKTTNIINTDTRQNQLEQSIIDKENNNNKIEQNKQKKLIDDNFKIESKKVGNKYFFEKKQEIEQYLLENNPDGSKNNKELIDLYIDENIKSIENDNISNPYLKERLTTKENYYKSFNSELKNADNKDKINKEINNINEIKNLTTQSLELYGDDLKSDDLNEILKYSNEILKSDKKTTSKSIVNSIIENGTIEQLEELKKAEYQGVKIKNISNNEILINNQIEKIKKHKETINFEKSKFVENEFMTKFDTKDNKDMIFNTMYSLSKNDKGEIVINQKMDIEKAINKVNGEEIKNKNINIDKDKYINKINEYKIDKITDIVAENNTKYIIDKNENVKYIEEDLYNNISNKYGKTTANQIITKIKNNIKEVNNKLFDKFTDDNLIVSNNNTLSLENEIQKSYKILNKYTEKQEAFFEMFSNFKPTGNKDIDDSNFNKFQKVALLWKNNKKYGNGNMITNNNKNLDFVMSYYNSSFKDYLENPKLLAEKASKLFELKNDKDLPKFEDIVEDLDIGNWSIKDNIDFSKYKQEDINNYKLFVREYYYLENKLPSYELTKSYLPTIVEDLNIKDTGISEDRYPKIKNYLSKKYDIDEDDLIIRNNFNKGYIEVSYINEYGREKRIDDNYGIFKGDELVNEYQKNYGKLNKEEIIINKVNNNFNSNGFFN